MKNDIRYTELRRLLLEIGFLEASGPKETVFRHVPSDTLFVFRPYQPEDPVAGYNLIEVRNLLDARGLMSGDTFESQFKKTPA